MPRVNRPKEEEKLKPRSKKIVSKVKVIQGLLDPARW